MSDWSPESMQRVAALASAAPGDPAGWSGLVEAVSAMFSARSAVLFTPEPDGRFLPLGIAQGELAHGMADYFGHWAHDDAWLRAVEGKGFFQRAGQAHFTQEFLADSALKKTAFFSDWGRRYGAEQALVLKVTDSRDANAPVMHLSLFRKLSDAPFSKLDRTRLQLLWPLLQQAAQVHWSLQPVRQSGASSLEGALELLPVAVWIVRDDGRIDFANAAARDAATTGLWVQVRAHRIERLGQLEAAELAVRLRAALRSRGAEAGVSALSLARDGQLRRGQLRLLPIADSPAYAAAWPQARLLLMLQTASSPAADAQWLSHLAERFRLTGAQAAVLESLGRGLSVDAIGQARGIRPGTVRAHLHELLAKTERETQADLVALALGR